MEATGPSIRRIVVGADTSLSVSASHVRDLNDDASSSARHHGTVHVSGCCCRT